MDWIGWPSSAEEWQEWLIAVAVLGAVFTFALAIAGALVSRHVIKLEKEESRQKDLQIALAQSSADTARLQAEEAKKASRQIEGKNILLQQQLEASKIRAAEVEAMLTTKQTELQAQNAVTASALQGAAALVREQMFRLQQITSLFMPRKLEIGSTRDAFRYALSKYPKGSVEVFWQADMFILEPEQFAGQIIGVLEELGWTIAKKLGVLIVSPEDPLSVEYPAGIRLFVHSKENIPQQAQAIESAFSAAGFSSYVQEGKHIPEGIVRIMIFMVSPGGDRVLMLRGE